jgi:radical SAM superfamily enzyme YgiQ (UPF0313 family)
MKIMMVRPAPSTETIGLQHMMIVEPLELEILAALKRPGDTVEVVDMILEKKPFATFIREWKPDVLCLTGYITNVSTIIAYCREAKQISGEITTIVGGVHCEVCPVDFEDGAVDFRVVRNATSGFTALLEHIEKNTTLPPGMLRKGEIVGQIVLPPFDFSLPFPDRASVAKYRNDYFYIFQDRVALIKTSFGCPFQCSFCFCRVITSGKYFQRPMDEVIAEIKQIDESEIYIVDDDFLVDIRRLQEFILEIRKHAIRKHFLVYGRADFIAANPGIMHELAGIGLKTVIVGFESFSNRELNAYNKHTDANTYAETMKVLHNEKIDCFATIIIPPHYDRQDFSDMVKAIKKLGIHFVNLQPLTPLPGTEMTFPEDQVIISRKDYEKWDLAHVTVMPEKLSVADFYEEILKAYKAILYRPETLWKYLTSYKPKMLIKMLKGGARVTQQYREKIKEARNYA